MKNRVLIYLANLTTMGCIVLAAGCATTTAQTLPLKFETDSGNAIRITSAQARSNEDGILVSGGITRNIPYSVPPGAHLHVIAMDAKDKIIANGVSTINPHMLQHGHRGQSTPATYTSQLPVAPESVSKVKVVYHDHHHNECDGKCG